MKQVTRWRRGEKKYECQYALQIAWTSIIMSGVSPLTVLCTDLVKIRQHSNTGEACSKFLISLIQNRCTAHKGPVCHVYLNYISVLFYQQTEIFRQELNCVDFCMFINIWLKIHRAEKLHKGLPYRTGICKNCSFKFTFTLTWWSLICRNMSYGGFVNWHSAIFAQKGKEIFLTWFITVIQR